MPGIDKTERYYRVRQRNPVDFDPKSFRTVEIAEGIKSIQGKLKGENTMTIQSLLFDVKKWSLKEVEDWIKEHNFKIL